MYRNSSATEINGNEKNTERVLQDEEVTEGEDVAHTRVEDDASQNLPRRRVYGLILMALGGLYVVMSNVLVQLVHEYSHVRISPLTILFLRSVVTFAFASVFMICSKVNPIPSRAACFKLTALGLSGVSGILFMYVALGKIPVGDVTVIQFTIPFFTTILSVVFLCQKLMLMDVVCGLFSFFGLLIMTRPTSIFGKQDIDSREISECMTGESDITDTQDQSEYLQGVFYALLASVLVSVFFILSKVCGKQGDVMLIILYTGAVGVILPTVINLITQQYYRIGQQWDVWTLLILIGILSFVHLLFVAESLQLEEAGPVALIRNADSVYAFVLQYTVLGVAPKPLTLVGAAVVVAATTCMGGYRYYTAKKMPKSQ